MAQVGPDGCGFEQPLAAVRASLEHPANANFLRPEALLVVVVLTDEDDCSAFEPALFGPDTTQLGGLYLTDLGELAGAVVAAKPDPTQVMVSVIRGVPGPIHVSTHPPSGMLQLAPTCFDADGGGVDPALRLDRFLDYFPGRSWIESICDSSPARRGAS